MLDFSWQELAVTGVVALVVLGPKELPGLMRTAGRWARRAQQVAQEFRFNLDTMVDDIELEEARKTAVAKADKVEPVLPQAREDGKDAGIQGEKTSGTIHHE